MTALAFVHSKNLAHRDLKTENVIYDNSNGHIQLIDFGFACSTRDKLRQWCGTPAYMSPEIVLKKEYDGKGADIWASGVLLYYMFFGTLPFIA